MHVTITLLCLNLFSFFGRNEFQEELQTSDSVVVTFYKEYNPNDPENITRTITSPTTIKELSDITTGRRSPWYKCSYTGSLRWYKIDTLLTEEMRFNMADRCTHIVYDEGEKSRSRKIPQRVQALLRSWLAE